MVREVILVAFGSGGTVGEGGWSDQLLGVCVCSHEGELGVRWWRRLWWRRCIFLNLILFVEEVFERHVGRYSGINRLGCLT